MDSGNEDFRKMLAEAAGSDRVDRILAALEQPASVSIRSNPFKKQASAFDGEPVPWNRHGMILGDRPVFTLDPFLHAGCYYVQDSSSMFTGYVLRFCLENMFRDMDRTIRVLDLCAAPGGKTTDAAASLREFAGGGFVLVSNEVMRQRASVLADNVAIWGDPNVVATSSDPSCFSSLNGVFDVILADVPCSGEGMFRKDRKAVEQWSAGNVELCAARQRRILADVWPALAEDGVLIYSTCTFNRYENDGNAGWVADTLGADIVHLPDTGIPEGVLPTGNGYSLFPGFVPGEGQYCAILRKTSAERNTDIGKDTVKRKSAGQIPDGLFSIPVRAVERNGVLKAVPEAIADDVMFLEKHLRVISSGCAAGTLKGKDFVPSADLALDIFLAEGAFPRVEVDRRTALSFLHRETVVLPGAEKGFLLICHEGVPLGFVKNLGGRCNNLHPQERRIRMDIGK